MALAGLVADYGSSSEEEQEAKVQEESKADRSEPPENAPKKKSLLPSANDLFDTIDGPAFMSGSSAERSKRQAHEISRTHPSLTIPSPTTLLTSPKRPAAGSGSKPVSSTSSQAKRGENGLLLPPQVSRRGGRGNVVTEDISAWTSKAGLAKATSKKDRYDECTPTNA
ncbi:hypothetical protein NSK_004509 [Nannochloropsis salina CCMP1776]|uniref:Uncharacterized protein n=1 Tax=Nannochloropsis salina CCMP1776 TaxID=1027361 RepID=A0A4D9D0U4_9STRA|nr:hypothetical protein NSK_004509 [Nannochloropsis salina CCMP1776]|eukprot:TFJ84524.1 hypothetical protein NSK_004509 [Nannochloropsis salina CCMP1776]